LIGVVSFFADYTYEGSRSIVGPYLAVLGASATVVGIVAGFGELLGYALRLVSGRLSDRTGRFWLITLFGYVIQMSSVPLLAFAESWQAVALLIVTERIGKAIRNPPRDVMLSHAAREIGYGWGFGVHEAMDQFGALFVAGAALALTLSYGHTAASTGAPLASASSCPNGCCPGPCCDDPSVCPNGCCLAPCCDSCSACPNGCCPVRPALTGHAVTRGPTARVTLVAPARPRP
jgi:hypothetical protein